MAMDETLLGRAPDTHLWPPTYTDPEFARRIFQEAGLNVRNTPARVIEFVHGVSSVVTELLEDFPNHDYALVSASRAVLDEFHTPGLGKVIADIRETLPFEADSIDAILSRYGIKDNTLEQQQRILRKLLRILKPGGVLVIADMVSPQGQEDWLNGHHRLKQRLSGRDEAKNGVCYIPTKTGWLTMLAEAGFQAEVVGYHTSNVNTQNWVDSQQITAEKKEAMDRNILAAPDDVKAAFMIREEADGVHIDYPVVIIRAVKPAVEIPASSDAESGGTMHVYL